MPHFSLGFPASNVLVDRLSGSTYSTLQQFVNTMHSPGLISGGGITVLSATQVRVAAGTGMIRVADDNVSSMPFFNWAQTDFTIPADDVVRYFGVVYNAGAPIVEMRTAESWDKDTEFALGSALHISSNGILVLSNPYKSGDPITNIIQRFDAAAPVLRDSYVGGLIISNTGTRNIAITGGTLWHRLNDNTFASFDSSGASRFTTVYYNGTNWVYTMGVAQWPNTQYNDVASGLVNITGNRYVNLWFYIGATGNNVFMVYGQAQHVQLADAFAEGEPTFFPTNTRQFVVLVGKLTFQNGGATPTQLLSPFTAASLGFGSVNTHNDLSGLQGGVTGEYYHLSNAAYSNIAAGVTALPQFAGIVVPAANFLWKDTGGNTVGIINAEASNGGLSGVSPQWFLGTAAPSGDCSALLIGRTLSGSRAGGSHGVRDESTYNGSGGGLLGYASFDSAPVAQGSSVYNHIASFQSRIEYTGSGSIPNIQGLTYQPTHTGSGTIGQSIAVFVDDALGSGAITTQIGVYFDQLSRGSNNFSIYSSGTQQSYHEGLWQVGNAVQSATAFRAFVSGQTDPGQIVAGTQHRTIGANATAVIEQWDSFGAAQAFISRRANGTSAALSALTAGQDIYSILVRGHDGTAYSSTAAQLQAQTVGNWTTSNHDTRWIFRTADIGGLSMNPQLTIDSTGITTSAPSGSTARPWKLGDVSAVSPTAPNRTVAIDVNGTVLYLHAKTTND